MELKYDTITNWILIDYLLIVPYGIEIFARSGSDELPLLLIVPYGIEIHKDGRTAHRPGLLIVPYGIEIHSRQIRRNLSPGF